jgi:GWxTD domain-containing protein
MLGRDRDKADALYESGLQQLSLGKEDSALESFRAAAKNNRRLASAYFEIAKIYQKRDTVRDIWKGDEALRKAVLHDPDNAEYRLALANMHMKRNLVSSAEREFKRVVQLDSTQAEAWFQLGYIHEQEYLHLLNMTSGYVDDDTTFRSGASDFSGLGTIYFDEFAENERNKCEYFYKLAIMNDPNRAATYYRLGFLYYEEENWWAMAEIFRQALQQNSGDKNAHLYMALAHHRLGRLANANNEYQLAWSLMDAEERDFYSSIGPLQSNNVRNVSLPVDGESKKSAARAYWQSRDPLYLTDYNERIMEHFARIAYVNLRFSNPYKKTEGWKTDRGKVYIRYGSPARRSKTSARLNMQNPSSQQIRSSPLVPSKEIWSYSGFQFVFEDAYLNRDYQFKWGMGANDDYKDVYRRMVKTTPEYYHSPYENRVFDLPVIVHQFMQADGEPILYVYSGVPIKQIDSRVSPSQNRVTAQLEKGVFLFDDDWQPVSTSITDVSIKRRINQTAYSDYFFATDSLKASPGKYHFALEYMDESSKRVGRFLDSLLVRDFASETLALSDLVLANEIRLRTDILNVSRSQIGISPNFDHSFRPGQDLYLYYEIYNLSLGFEGFSKYKISYTIRRLPDKPKGLSRLVKLLRGKASDQPVVATSHIYQGNRTRENHYHILQLTGYEPGDYELVVDAEDQIRGVLNKREIKFRIAEN